MPQSPREMFEIGFGFMVSLQYLGWREMVECLPRAGLSHSLRVHRLEQDRHNFHNSSGLERDHRALVCRSDSTKMNGCSATPLIWEYCFRRPALGKAIVGVLLFAFQVQKVIHRAKEYVRSSQCNQYTCFNCHCLFLLYRQRRFAEYNEKKRL